MLSYNLPINRDTVHLHNEYSQTSCPHDHGKFTLVKANLTQEEIN